MSLTQILDEFKDYFSKFYYLKLDENWCKMLLEDGIIVDQTNLNMVSEQAQENIKQIITEFDALFIKLNNKSGGDASFMCPQLKCFSLEDIIILLKSSKRMINCLNTNIFSENILILKEWYKIDKKFEFRAYLISGELKLISQRYLNFYGDYSESLINDIKNTIYNFCQNKEFKEKINKVFKNQKYVYIDFLYSIKKKKVWVIDIEADDDNTKNCLKFYKTWEEIFNLKEIEFKTIENENQLELEEINGNKFPVELENIDLETLINELRINDK